MKFPIPFRVFAAINLVAFLLQLLQTIVLITSPKLGLIAASVSIIATAWLLIASFMWFFGSRYSYPLLYLTSLVVMASVLVVTIKSFESDEASISKDILLVVLYWAIPLIYSTFLIVSMFFRPVKEWAKTVHTPRTHSVPAIILMTITVLSFGSLLLFDRSASKTVLLESVYASETLPSGGFIIDYSDLMEFDQIVISTDYVTANLDLLIYFADNYDASETGSFNKFETLVFKPLSEKSLQSNGELPSVGEPTIFLSASLPITKAKRIMIVPITGALQEGKTLLFSLLHSVRYFDKNKSPEQFITSDGIDKPSYGDEIDYAPYSPFRIEPEEIIENRDLPEPKSITPEERAQMMEDFIQKIVDDYGQIKYVFNYDTPRMTIDTKSFGFYAGLQSIFRFQSGDALTNLLNRKDPGDERDLSLNDKIWEISGRGLYTNLEDFNLPFNGLNPNFLSWAKAYLLPQPNEQIMGFAASAFYNNMFRRSVWLLAVSHEYFKDEKFYQAEANAYRQAMAENGFYGPTYLRKRFDGIDTNAPIFGKLYKQFPKLDNEFFYFDEPVAAGFWLRRKLDNSEAETWDFIKSILNTYDSYSYEQ